jgi:hypothetical protein
MGSTILKWIFKKSGGGMDWIDLDRDRDRWRALVSCTETLGTIKWGISWVTKDLLTSQKGLCPTKIVLVIPRVFSKNCITKYYQKRTNCVANLFGQTSYICLPAKKSFDTEDKKKKFVIGSFVKIGAAKAIVYLGGVNEFLSLSTFILRFGWNSVKEIST